MDSTNKRIKQGVLSLKQFISIKNKMGFSMYQTLKIL